MSPYHNHTLIPKTELLSRIWQIFLFLSAGQSRKKKLMSCYYNIHNLLVLHFHGLCLFHQTHFSIKPDYRCNVQAINATINNTLMEQGLTSHQAQEQLEKFGKNEIALQTPFSISKAILAELGTVINGILALAALFSFYINNIIDGVFILAVIALNTILSFIQEYKAEKALEKLKMYTSSACTTLRDGKIIQIPTNQLVPEDIV